jgi:hypothetical protein
MTTAQQRVADAIADLELALDLALAWLGEHEPGDSRAVSNEFVAMAAIRCEQDNLEECRAIIRAALRASNKEQEQ